MKILMLGWELPPYHSGGLGVACYQLCKALAQQGVVIEFMLPYTNQHKSVDFMTITPALSVPPWLLRQNGTYDSSQLQAASNLRAYQRAYTQAVVRQAQDKQYDIVHAHDWLTFEAGLAIKKHRRIPLIAHVHATEFDRSGRQYGNPIVHEIEQQALSLADKVVAVSHATKQIIEREYRIPSSAITVLHNSIDVQDFFKPPATQQTYVYLEQMKRRGYKVVVSLGRLTVQKGLTFLLQAAQLVIAKQPKTLFLIAGTGEQYHELIELSASLGIAQNIVFTGVFTGGKAQRDAFEIADIFVMPSVSEPFGLTALEAVGNGGVALISKQAGVGEVLQHVLKFDFWDTNRLADQIIAVNTHAGLRRELQRNAQAEFSQLSWQKVADLCQQLYQAVARSKVVV